MKSQFLLVNSNPGLSLLASHPLASGILSRLSSTPASSWELPPIPGVSFWWVSTSQGCGLGSVQRCATIFIACRWSWWERLRHGISRCCRCACPSTSPESSGCISTTTPLDSSGCLWLSASRSHLAMLCRMAYFCVGLPHQSTPRAAGTVLSAPGEPCRSCLFGASGSWGNSQGGVVPCGRQG